MEPSRVLTFDELLGPAVALPQPLFALSLLWAFLIGAAIGSFLNVVIARVPRGESVVRPRSRCPKCKTPIAWYDNIPLLSWVVLRARCRHCATPIPARYPLVELLLALLTVAVVARHGFTISGAELLVLGAVLVALAFIDLDTWEVPLELTFLVAGVGLLVGVLGGLGVVDATPIWLRPALSEPGWSALLDRGIGLGAGFASLACINVVATVWFRLRGRIEADEWAMGWGDAYLLAAMGAVLGWRALPMVIFLSSLQGAIVGVILTLTGRMPAARDAEHAAHDDASREGEEDAWQPPPTAVPFVPFLALAGLEVAFLGDRLLPWLSSLLRLR